MPSKTPAEWLQILYSVQAGVRNKLYIQVTQGQGDLQPYLSAQDEIGKTIQKLQKAKSGLSLEVVLQISNSFMEQYDKYKEAILTLEKAGKLNFNGYQLFNFNTQVTGELSALQELVNPRSHVSSPTINKP